MATAYVSSVISYDSNAKILVENPFKCGINDALMRRWRKFTRNTVKIMAAAEEEAAIIPTAMNCPEPA